MKGMQKVAAIVVCVLLWVGVVAFAQGEGEKTWNDAVALFEEALEARNKGHYWEAIALFEEALAIMQALEEPLGEAVIMNDLGLAYQDLGRYEEALAVYESARSVFAANQMLINVAKVDNNIGNVYQNLGRYDEALAAYELARTVFVENQMFIIVATVDQNIGLVYGNIGRYEEALAVYESARSIFVENQMFIDVAKVDENIGLVYGNVGRYEEALAMYESARTVYIANQMFINVAKVDMNIGVEYWNLGRYEKSLAMYESARTVYVEKQMVIDVAKVDNNIGNVYLALGRYEEALAVYESARTVYIENQMGVNVANVGSNIGIVYRNLGRYEEALAAYKSAESAINAVGAVEEMVYSYPTTRWRIYFNMGIAREALEDWDDAVAAYQDSIDVIESIRGNLASEDLKLAWQEKTSEVYEYLIDLLYRMKKGSLAFTYAERCRARTFLDALYQGGITADQLISPEAGISSGAVDPEVIAQAVDDARELLQPNEAVVEYMVTDNGVYVWVVTEEGIADPEFIEYPRDQLMNDVITLRQAIEGSDPITATAFLVSFYEKLVQGSLATLSDSVDTLIIIPSGPLWYLPFSALMMVDPEAPDEARVPYLLEHYTLAYLPSLASLPSLAQEDAAVSTSLLALADPERSLVPVYESGESPCGDETALGRYEGLVVACQAFADQLLAREEQATQWVYAAEEAQEALAYQVSGRQVVVYAVHGQFNAYVPLQSKLLLAPSEETETADSERRTPDGNYHAWEVLLTDYRGTELVVLAACETLLPHLNDVKGTLAVMSDQTCDEVDLTPQQLEKIVVGDEVVGLARAFLSSGAEAVVGTLWLASANVIEELLVSMAEYYKQGAPWVQALTKAQRDLIDHPVYGSVWFWAPYQLIGRWR